MLLTAALLIVLWGLVGLLAWRERRRRPDLADRLRWYTLR